MDDLVLGIAYFTNRLNLSQFEASKSISREAYVRMIDHVEAGIPPGSRTSWCWGTPGSSWRSGARREEQAQNRPAGGRDMCPSSTGSSQEPPRSAREGPPGHRVRATSSPRGGFPGLAGACARNSHSLQASLTGLPPRDHSTRQKGRFTPFDHPEPCRRQASQAKGFQNFPVAWRKEGQGETAAHLVSRDG